MDFKAIAKNFVDTYYAMYNTHPSQGEEYARIHLGQIYTDQTLATFQDREMVGVQDIMNFIALPSIDPDTREEIPCPLINHMKRPEHHLAQPSINNTILIWVQGTSGFTDQENTQPFTEIFLIAQEEGRFFIINEVFSLHGV